ncbi:phage portal protein [Actinoplanes sp. N902-109]|uniref:phage portal protein n=1 Tax=Actinoplanes sp. (strain N902-109) TaxID=649831 RepID=UPI000329502D|nr:phage portal protein [Actinoplanes sp. N902-109]AGL19507.1 HK97 family phage portal protein [Actinoplanes sp. N902-109]
MTLIRAAAEAFRDVRNTTSIENPAMPLTSAALVEWLGGPKVASGVRVTEENSLGMMAVWRAVNLIAGTSASLPLHAYRREDDVRVKLSDRSLSAQLLSDPHPDLTPFELWEIIYAHVLLWGNAYLRKLTDQNGRIRELWPIHPSRVRAGRESETASKVYEIDGGQVEHTDATILHIPGFGYDGVCGVSPIRLAREGIGLAMAAERYGASLFGSGSLAAGILQTEQRLKPEQADALKSRWKAKASGLANAHDVVVLDNGAKFQQLSIPPEDAQFIESRTFQIDEVARMFGLPPHMLAQTEKSTSWGTGIEQQGIGFVIYTLRPWLTRMEQRVSRLLRPEAVYARYGVEGLLRGDTQQRAEFYRKLWEIGVLSTNDIRRLEDMAPVEGGDVRYRPLNMGLLGALDAIEGAPADA